MKMKEESEKAGLKLNIQKTKIMASSPITSWQIDGATMKTVTDFIILGPKITADSDCSHEVKTLAPWKKSYDLPRQHIQHIDLDKAFDCVNHNKLWKILKEIGIPDHLTCLLRNLCTCQEATDRTGYGTMDWFKIWKGVRHAVYCHPAYLTSMQNTS